jgi:hypothetical protein
MVMKLPEKDRNILIEHFNTYTPEQKEIIAKGGSCYSSWGFPIKNSEKNYKWSTIEGIDEQVKEFKYDVGLLYYFHFDDNPNVASMTQRAVKLESNDEQR